MASVGKEFWGALTQSKFKSERQAEKKADAGNKSSWNALFMRPDTVAAAVAARFGARVQSSPRPSRNPLPTPYPPRSIRVHLCSPTPLPLTG